jgi:hypothetical protein
MEEGAYIGGVIAGLAFLIAGVRLSRLSLRTREAPERLLGVTFLLWGLAGVTWAVWEVAETAQIIEYSVTGVWSATMDSLVGGLEVGAIALIWLVFFPPAVYRRWIDRAAPAAMATGD